MNHPHDTFENTLQIELNRTKAALELVNRKLSEVTESLQSDLTDWAGHYLTPGDEDHNELNELMQNNGLEGLNRTYTVSVSVRYTFEVDVEAVSDDAASELVDNNIYDYIRDNLDISYYDDVDLEVTEV